MSILVNGIPTKEFTPKKGLRQGDPLTPFFFLKASKGLLGVSRNVVDKSLFESIEVGYKKVTVHMLQYAYDTLFFCAANIKSVHNLRVMLNCFELAFGLKVNFFEEWNWRGGG